MWAERNADHDLAASIKTLTVNREALAASHTSKAFRLQYYVIFKEITLFLKEQANKSLKSSDQKNQKYGLRVF